MNFMVKYSRSHNNQMVYRKDGLMLLFIERPNINIEASYMEDDNSIYLVITVDRTDPNAYMAECVRTAAPYVFDVLDESVRGNTPELYEEVIANIKPIPSGDLPIYIDFVVDVANLQDEGFIEKSILSSDSDSRLTQYDLVRIWALSLIRPYSLWCDKW